MFDIVVLSFKHCSVMKFHSNTRMNITAETYVARIQNGGEQCAARLRSRLTQRFPHCFSAQSTIHRQ